MVPLHINKFLCFLTVQFDKIDRENLIAVLVDSYVFCQALEAKNSIKEFTKTRQEAKSAAALRRVVTDAVDIWSVVDRENCGTTSG